MNVNVCKLLCLLVGIQLVKSLTTPSKGCLDPGPIDNGSREPPPIQGYLKMNTIIHYYCDDNYISKGAKKIICDNENQWLPQIPECIPTIYCQEPNIPNGKISGTTVPGSQVHYNPNTKAELTCDTGYEPSTNGESVNHCGDNGMWSYTWAQCQDSNECSSNNICQHGGFCINTEGAYLCHCRGDYFGVNCEKEVIKGCLEPENVTNAYRHFGREPSPDNGYYYLDTRVTYTCINGYTMTGSNALFCIDGQWEGSYPTCSIKCGHPPTVPHSTYKPNFELYSTSDKVTYACQEGFYLVGNAVITCDVGNWTGTGLTTCAPQYYCPDPGTPANGDRCCQEVFIPTVTLKFYCNTDYILIGNKEISCQTDGTWNTVAPVCQLESPDTADGGQHMLTNETFTIVVAISGSIMGILTVTIILSIRECCTQRRRRPRCRYHSSSIATRVARMRERHNSHLLSLTANMEVPLPSYEEATAGVQQPGNDVSSLQTAENNDERPPELPPRPASMTHNQQPVQSQQRLDNNPTLNAPPIPRSSRVPSRQRRRRESQQQSVTAGPLMETSSELNELPNSNNSLQMNDCNVAILDSEDGTTLNNDNVSLESGVMSDQQDGSNSIPLIQQN
ncbi:CUB and sushi domain-containing protein 3-like isoform X2 [Antedon mediterranea]|uniref:CUB and sushi domain-containing protein 3-like isoform X2 n=1 Tax=Antedon mediterranea TaxID=105859 RepID=UPI003AF9489E